MNSTPESHNRKPSPGAMKSPDDQPLVKRGLHRFDPHIEADILHFFEVAYPHRSKDLIGPRWRWMFLESAARCDVDPYVWIHHDGVRVTGHQGAIAVRYWDGSQEITTGWFVETMTLPDVRGATIGPAVVMKAKQDLPMNLSLGQTEAMRALQFRLGWEQVAPLKTSVKPIRWRSVLRGKLPAFVVPFAAVALSLRDSLIGFKNRASQIQVSQIDRFDERHDALWKEFRKHVGACVVRDAAYFNWKYVSQPGQDFVRLEFTRHDEVLGIAVFKMLAAGGVYQYDRAHVIEFVGPPDDPETLTEMLLAVTSECARQGAEAVVMMHLADWLDGPLAAAGFQSREATRFLLVHPGPLKGSERSNLVNAQRWYLTQGDSDIDRP